MAKNFIFILAEGDHDSSFLYRILRAYDVETDSKIIKEYPSPLNNLFTTGISNVSISDLNIQDAGSRFLPYRVMQQGENTFIIYTIGGDTQKNKRIVLAKAINAFNVQDPDAIQVLKDTTISILYFFDADTHGVNSRLLQVKSELGEIFENSTVPDLTNGELVTIEDMRIGAFIFTDVGADSGRLEDFLVPLMEQDNKDIFTAARNFLGIHEATVLFKGKCKVEGGILKKVNGQKYNHLKSLVGTVGQLQKSGKSNTVCISDADYLNATKIKASDPCVNIFTFIKKAMV